MQLKSIWWILWEVEYFVTAGSSEALYVLHKSTLICLVILFNKGVMPFWEFSEDKRSCGTWRDSPVFNFTS